jgi:hypothetical protein
MTENDKVRDDGVLEKVNVDPPFIVLKLDAFTVDETLKSAAMPVVVPEAPETMMVHTTGKPIRDGLVLTHDTLLDDEGLP